MYDAWKEQMVAQRMRNHPSFLQIRPPGTRQLSSRVLGRTIANRYGNGFANTYGNRFANGFGNRFDSNLVDRFCNRLEGKLSDIATQTETDRQLVYLASGIGVASAWFR